MPLEVIQGELCMIEETSGHIVHVFTQGNLSRASYLFMIHWVQTNFDSKLGANELWSLAKNAWDSMSIQNQIYHWLITCRQ